MRVNVDDIAFMDRRFKLLGGRLSMTWQEALGRCLPVWALAYAKRTAILPAGDVDALAERPGFADAMVLVDLASEEPSGAVYLCGVNDRIDFLLMQDAKREKAREARLAAAGVQSPPGRGPTLRIFLRMLIMLRKIRSRVLPCSRAIPRWGYQHHRQSLHRCPRRYLPPCCGERRTSRIDGAG